MKDIKLYINGKLVDCSEDLSLPITYTTEDLKNPTIVKNSFSKTITIPGTKENNKLFEEIYKLDRRQAFNSWNFNPSKRVDFTIYNNSDVVESGYVQLNKINLKDEIVSYEITLYGGLGDFFYGLKYKEDGSTKTLADIRYFVEDEEGNVLPEETEMDFKINKDFVKASFEKLYDAWQNKSTINDIVCFAPSYNGLYENFDSEHCLINTNDDTIFPKSGGDGFSTYNGYALASLNKSYTEWEMRDLRSYMQRPVLKLSKVIDAICREENSGYKVNFDPVFFNDSNPYWTNAYIALPLLGSKSESKESMEDNAKLIKSNDLFWCGLKPGQEVEASNFGRFSVEGSDLIVPGENNTIDTSGLPVSSQLSIDLPVNLIFNINAPAATNDLYLSYVLNGENDNLQFNNRPFRTAITLQLTVYDLDGNPFQPVAYSKLYNFTNSIPGNNPSGPDNWFNYRPWKDEQVETILGHFVRYDDNRFIFKADNGSNVFRLTLDNIPKVKKMLVYLSIQRMSENLENKDRMWSSYDINASTGTGAFTVYGWSEVAFDPSQYTMTAKWSSTIGSDTLITKKTLLRTDNSPADFLLSYTKLFGLYFTKDVDSKTINIYTRNTFFKNIVNDWSKRIDYSKEISINPLMFDKKWYTMSLDTPETYYASKYDSQYDITYGQQRMDTGYNFNSENTDLYEDNIYQNVISARDTDKYFRNFFNTSSVYVPAFMNDNITYTLYKTQTGEVNGWDQDLYGVNFIDPSKTTEWYTVPGNDVFAKTCFYSLTNSEPNLEDITSSILFYNDSIQMWDVDRNPIYYYLTDDIEEMGLLNDGDSCYLYTTSEVNSLGKTIAIKVQELPQFIRYRTTNDQFVYCSLDFGLPKEAYIDNIEYNEQSTVYYKFWRSFYDDQFDVNTKVVTCYVKLNDLYVSEDLLRQFYYFENSLWVLNKIDSYDINSYSTVRCEFIKVQNIENYTDGILPTTSEITILSDDNLQLDYQAGTATYKVWSPYKWETYLGTTHKWEPVKYCYPKTGESGVFEFSIDYKENPKPYAVTGSVRIREVGEITGPYATFTQQPNPDNIYILSGKITLTNPSDVSGVSVGIFLSDDEGWEGTVSDDWSSYSVTVPRNTQVKIIYRTYGTDPIIKEENITLTADTTKDLVL